MLLTERVRGLDAACALDYGSGAGYPVARTLRDAGFSVVAADLSFKKATSGGKGILLAPPLIRVGQFNVAVASRVLNVQRSEQEVEDVFDDVYGALLPGGRFWFDYPTEPRKWTILGVPASACRIERLAEDAGLNVLRRWPGLRDACSWVVERPA
jgi:SAM-dependent methyltransferase